MNPAYLHLLINHIPVILAPLGLVAAILGHVTKRRAVWLYALATLTLAGLSAYPVMATGDAAGDFVRDHVAAVDRKAIESHGESGDTVMWVLLVGGAFAAYGWWHLARGRESELPLWLAILVLVTAALSTAGVAVVSEKGGEIMHQEAHMAPGSPPLGATHAPLPASGQSPAGQIQM